MEFQVNQVFDQGAGRRFCQIDNSMTGRMPAG
jgi:hypothetical protein